MENYQLITLVQTLKKKSIEDNVGLWKRIANDLEKPVRRRRVVNLSRIDLFAKENEIIVVPGKVLGSGELSKTVTIAAYACSDSAKEKIAKNKSNVITIEELLKKNPKTTEVRILG